MRGRLVGLFIVLIVLSLAACGGGTNTPSPTTSLADLENQQPEVGQAQVVYWGDPDNLSPNNIIGVVFIPLPTEEENIISAEWVKQNIHPPKDRQFAVRIYARLSLEEGEYEMHCRTNSWCRAFLSGQNWIDKRDESSDGRDLARKVEDDIHAFEVLLQVREEPYLFEFWFRPKK